jgi:hypothetical protein
MIFCLEKRARPESRAFGQLGANELRSTPRMALNGIHVAGCLRFAELSVPREYWAPRVAGSSTSRWLADAVPLGLGNGRASRKGQARRLSVCNFVSR